MDGQPITTEEYKGHRIEIWPDENAESPRTEQSNLGVMACFHPRYNLGDKTNLKDTNFAGWDDMAGWLKKEGGAVIVLPLFLYDHSGLRMKVGSFQGHLPQGHAEFDSGQVGFIYATREAILKTYEVKRITKALLKKAEEALSAEVKVYDQYLSGDVYGFRVFAPAKPPCKECGHKPEPEEVESCWGFYGQEEAMKDAKRVTGLLASEALTKS